MVEIECPNCGTRYQVPEDALGPDGRDVACSHCHHVWLAFPVPPAALPPILPDPEPEPRGVESPAAMPEPPMGRREPAVEASQPRSDDARMPSQEREEPSSDLMARLAAFSRSRDATQTEPPEAEAPPRRPEPPEEVEIDPRERLRTILAQDRPPAAAEPEEAPEEEEEAPAPPPPPRADDRRRQMAQIRKMVDQVQRTAPDSPDAPVEMPQFERPEDPIRRRGGAPVDEDLPGQLESTRDETDPLRARLAEKGVIKKDEKPKGGYDRGRLMGKHRRKLRRRKLSEEAGSGAFASGFLLVLIVMSVLVALYLLEPQISERAPEFAPALAEYVRVVDEGRTEIAEVAEGLRDTILERFDD